MKGHVRERGKGNWYAVLSTRDQQTGKRKVKFISLPDAGGKREAQQALAHILAELDSGTLVEPKKTTVAVTPSTTAVPRSATTTARITSPTASIAGYSV